jgi:hypothetical protein
MRFFTSYTLGHLELRRHLLLPSTFGDVPLVSLLHLPSHTPAEVNGDFE